ncbi:MAG: hypothetical protein EAX95_03280 [Candidatus Thorarchaeota archaeon]|nr:hypothetical protein [Candidatus Thorarchaeota archaeon]
MESSGHHTVVHCSEAFLKRRPPLFSQKFKMTYESGLHPIIIQKLSMRNAGLQKILQKGKRIEVL